jgi:hypothetical protein
VISIDLQCWNVLTKSIAIMTKNEKCAVVRSKRKLLSYCVAYWFQYCIVELFIVHPLKMKAFLNQHQPLSDLLMKRHVLVGI